MISELRSERDPGGSNHKGTVLEVGQKLATRSGPVWPGRNVYRPDRSHKGNFVGMGRC